jgi:gliding motility-associated-like protein
MLININIFFKIATVAMKLVLVIFAVLFRLSVAGQHSTVGTDFRLAFGQNYYFPYNDRVLNFQVRFVAVEDTKVSLNYRYDPSLNRVIEVPAGKVVTHVLSDREKRAVYNDVSVVSNKSLHITSDKEISCFALNFYKRSSDASNVLPVHSLGTEHILFGYTPTVYYSHSYARNGYVAVATADGTVLTDNGVSVATLNAGQSYSRYFSGSDATGRRISANKPVAFFTNVTCMSVPSNVLACDCVFQQLSPVSRWGTSFLVPVTNRGTDRIRVVASRDGTRVVHQGGSVKSGSLLLNAGQHVELEIYQREAGCFITADKPVAVCSYLVGQEFFEDGKFDDNEQAALGGVNGDPAMAWVPPVEQRIPEAIMAPFAVKGGISNIEKHFALIVTPTDSKHRTTAATGNGANVPLVDGLSGRWTDNHASGFSYYAMELTSATDVYRFRNPESGVTVMAFGAGYKESYYYLAASGTLKLDAAFYVDSLHYKLVEGRTFCREEFVVRADVKYAMHPDPGHLLWFVDGVEVSSARDMIEWTAKLSPGLHRVEMRVTDEARVEESLVTSFTVATSHAVEVRDAVLCRGAKAELRVENPVKGVDYLWFDDAAYLINTGSGESLTVEGVDASRKYYLKAGTDACESRTEAKVNVVEPPFVTPMPDAFICPGDSITLYSTASNGTVEWSVADLKVAPRSTAEYRVTARVDGCVDSTAKVTVTVGDSPVILPETLSPYSAGRDYSKQLSAGTGRGTYVLADGALPLGLSLSATGLIAGRPAGAEQLAVFTVRFTDERGCTALRSYTLVAEGSATFSVNEIEYGDLKGQSFCREDYLVKATIPYALHTDPGSLRWFVNGVEATDAADLKVWNRDLAEGSYEIRMEARNEHGDMERLAGRFAVVAPPKVVARPDTFVCRGDVVRLYVIESEGTVTWSVASATVRPDTTSLYFVEAVKEGCPAAHDTVKITVGDSLYILPEALWPYRTGAAYSRRLSSNAAPGASYGLVAGALPEGLNLSADGTIAGIPSGGSSTATFTVSVTDAAGCRAIREYTMSMQGSASFSVNGIHYVDLDGDVFCRSDYQVRGEVTYALHSDPGALRWFLNGAEVEAAKDRLEWSLVLPEGHYEIRMEARNEYGDTETLVGQFAVVLPPVVVARPDTFLCRGDEATLYVMQSDGAVKWNVDALTVRPSVTSLYFVEATKAGCPSVRDTVEIAVGDSLYIHPETLPACDAGGNCAVQLTTNAAAPRFSTVGALPPGLSLSADGQLSGTIAEEDSPASFTVLVTDASGCSTDRIYTLTRDVLPEFTVNGTDNASFSGTSCDGYHSFEAVVNYETSAARGFLKWYLNGMEVRDARDSFTWDTILAPGAWRVVMEVVSKAGDTDSASSSFTVSVRNEPDVKDLLVCAGDAAVFRVGNILDGAVYEWYDDEGLTSPVGTGTSFTVAALSGDTVLYVIATGGECATGRRVKASVVTPPSVTAMRDTFLCYGESVSLHTLQAEGEVEWNVPSVTVRPVLTTKYEVRAKAGFCPDAVDSVTVTVGDPLHVNPESLPVQVVGLQLSSNAEGGVFSTVEGTLPAGLTLEASGLITGNIPAGAYSDTFTVEVRDPHNCTARRTYVLSSDGTVSFRVNDIDYIAINGREFCERDYEMKADIDATLHTDAGRLRWFVDGTEEPGATDLESWTKRLVPGLHSIELHARKMAGDTVRLVTSFTVLKAGEPEIDDVTVCRGSPVELRVKNPSPETVFSWFSDSLSNTAVAAGEVFALPAVERDTLLYIESASNKGCRARTAVAIRALSPPSVQAAPDVFLCVGDTLTLETVQADGTVVWNVANTQISPAVTTEYVVKASKETCPDAFDTLRVEVGTPLHILPHTVPQYGAGKAYSLQFESNAESPSYSLAEGKLPEGLTLSKDGHLAGVATQSVYTETFTVRVTDVRGCTTVREYVLSLSTEIDLYVNGTNYRALTGTGFCGDSIEVELHADYEAQSIVWHIDGTEHAEAKDSVRWSATVTEGVHSIEMTVLRPDGEYDTLQSSFTVKHTPQALIDNVRVCRGERAEFTVKNQSGDFTYFWYGDEDYFAETGRGATHVIDTLTQDITLYVKSVSADGCGSESSVGATVVEPPELVAMADTFLCYGDKTSLYVVRAEGTVTWNVTDLEIAPRQSTQYIASTVGELCPSVSDTVLIVVGDSLRIVPESLPVYAPAKPYSAGLGTNASPFVFSLVDGALPDGLTLDASGVISGTPSEGTSDDDFPFTVKVEDNNSCFALREYVVRRETELGFLVNDIHYIDMEGRQFCLNDYDVRATVKSKQDEVLIAWIVDGREATDVENLREWSIRLPEGEHEIVMTAKKADGTALDTLKTHFTVTDPPRVTARLDTFLCYGDSAQLYVTDSEGEVKWNVSSSTVQPPVTSDYFVVASKPTCPDVHDTVRITVGDSLYIATDTLPSFDAAAAYSAQLSSNAAQPAIYSLVGGQLPAGLTLSESGLISGTPSGDERNSRFTAAVTDANGCTATRTYFLTRTGETGDAGFSVNGIPHVDLDGDVFCIEEYLIAGEVTYTLHTAPGHLRWFVNGTEEPAAADIPEWTTSLPEGLYEIKMRVVDSLGRVDTLAGNFEVVTPPRVTARPDTFLCYGDSARLYVTDSEGEVKWNVSSSTVQPLVTSDYFVVASKPTCPEAHDTVKITVGDSLYIATDTLPSFDAATVYSAQLSSNAAQPATYSLIGGQLPAGLTLSESGLISGTPSGNERQMAFAVRVTDTNGCTAANAYLLTRADEAGDAGFSVNGIPHTDLDGDVFCIEDYLITGEVTYAMHTDHGHLRWFVNGIEETAAADSLEWTANLPEGLYGIKMRIVDASGRVDTLTGNFETVAVPRVTARPDTFLCYGDSARLYVTDSEGEVKWNVSSSTVRPLITSDYFVVASKPTCPEARDTVRIEVGETLQLLPDKLPQYREKLYYSQSLMTNAESALYIVTEGSLPAGLTLDENTGVISGIPDNSSLVTTFTVTVTDLHGCSTSTEYEFRRNLIMPKVFTPNDDGVNDIFMPGYRIVIFDRLGKEIYRGDSGWDGKYKNRTVPCDIYFYVLFLPNENGRQETIDGYVGVEL